MKVFTAALLLLCSAMSEPAMAQLPVPYIGYIKGYENFPSAYVEPRNIDVWLPDDYSTDKKYAVLYMHDGQMLYDSSITWNKQEWGVDETVGLLLAENKIRDCIVVGIWNSGKNRHADYLPQKPLESLPKAQQDTLLQARRGNIILFHQKKLYADNYLRFIVTELKPFIDSAFSTHKERQHTFIAGSSMGGLISLYAICEYPEVFGGAACISTHWPGIFTVENNPYTTALFGYLKKNLPAPATHKIYFDYGNKTLDSLYPPLQRRADALMLQKGYTRKNWVTRFFDGDDHSEDAWRSRLHIPIEFLLGKR
ncbi:MAG TPA: alpha/beta hydrolase-fold protein [Ferruginibacter sp.]|nr:alpha/beta hydrolase-fold protein [Ferruginibacter sp.]HMP19616.1 alpha/beta hydrolase-fold protein [Ferruginibacter sp.]